MDHLNKHSGMQNLSKMNLLVYKRPFVICTRKHFTFVDEK